MNNNNHKKNVDSHPTVEEKIAGENVGYPVDLISPHKKSLGEFLTELHLMKRRKDTRAEQIKIVQKYVDYWKNHSKEDLLNYAAARKFQEENKADCIERLSNLVTVFCMDSEKNIVADTLVKELDSARDATFFRIRIDDPAFEKVKKYGSLEEYFKDMNFVPFLTYHDCTYLQEERLEWGS